MNINDDLKRNREIFEQLIGLESPVYEAAATRQSSFSPAVAEAAYKRAPLIISGPRRQRVETFSLNLGSLQSNEPSAPPAVFSPAGIEFPELSKSAVHTPDNALESLYHDLEVEARRMSQLICEEESG